MFVVLLMMLHPAQELEPPANPARFNTSVYHGYVNCGATGAITGIGCVLPREVLHLVAICTAAAKGDATARRLARELDDALQVLATVDAGPDLVLYIKHMMVLKGDPAYRLHFNENDALTPSQQGFVAAQLALFDAWYPDWSRQTGADRYAA